MGLYRDDFLAISYQAMIMSPKDETALSRLTMQIYIKPAKISQKHLVIND